jgi:recombinational DNA repair protein RecR
MNQKSFRQVLNAPKKGYMVIAEIKEKVGKNEYCLEKTEDKKCNFCGSNQYEERRTDYLYSYKGN